MTGVAVRVEGLGKSYRLGERTTAYRTLRESLAGLGTSPQRLLQRLARASSPPRNEELWALREVSFEVQQGEVLGVIGRNGAGKSTLLKILARITEPTTGRVELYGRIGSLLEVGTGFHPELTGRENIYLNGAILGTRRSEITARFDQIVDFASIDRFLDTPVKRYSSGMYVRLAFAVAAHMNPEILLIDEVLAVGDAAFQERCLGKMDEVAKGGRTVLFISHNMQAVMRLCHRAVLLDQGVCRHPGGPTEQVVHEYLAGIGQGPPLEEAVAAVLPTPEFRLLGIRMTQRGRSQGVFGTDERTEIAIEYEVKKRVRALRVYVDLCDEYGDILIRSFHDENLSFQSCFEPGVYQSTVAIPADLLAPRRYLLVVRATIFNVGSLTGSGVRVPFTMARTGTIDIAYDQPVRSKLQPRLEWVTESISRS